MNRKAQYRKYSYSQLWKDTKAYAAYFQSKGIKEGDVISFLLPTGEDFLAAFFAAQLIKAIPVSLYPPSSLTDLNAWSNKTKDMIDSVESHHLLTNLRISGLCNKITSDSISLILCEEISRFKGEPVFDVELFNNQDLCFLQFSSGTTGTPKAVMITQENAITNAKLIADALPCENSKIKVASWLPLYHDMGLVGCLLMSIINDTDIILIRPDDFIMKPNLWLQAIHDNKITCTTAPNFAYGLIEKRVSNEFVQNLDLSSMRAFLCGAEAVYKETMDKFIKHLAPANLDPKSVLPVYGMAETTLAVSFTDREKGMKFITVDRKKLERGRITESNEGLDICSVGEILPSFQVQIVNTKNIKLKNSSVGRILIKGPCVTDGYYNDKLKTEEMFIDSWLDSGDEGFIKDGELYICGRIKDTIIIRGSNYYPTHFEEKLYAISGVRKGRAIVSSVYNENNCCEEVVVLAEAESYDQLRYNKDKIIDEISMTIKNEGLPLYKVELYSPGILLKTSSGKLKRRENISLWKNNRLITQYSESIMKKSLQMFKIYTYTIKNKLKHLG
jgi:acyl-CoA synthetase (AMP-forming)/AMP-acid ligase II